MQTVLMLLLTSLCLVSAIHWSVTGNLPVALAFGGFALGYVGLAWAFAS
jgi:hypothetical protein